MKFKAFAAVLCVCGISPMDRLYTASTNNGIENITRLAVDVDVNAILESTCETRFIHRVMQNSISLKYQTLMALIRLWCHN